MLLGISLEYAEVKGVMSKKTEIEEASKHAVADMGKWHMRSNQGSLIPFLACRDPLLAHINSDFNTKHRTLKDYSFILAKPHHQVSALLSTEILTGRGVKSSFIISKGKIF